MATLHDELTLDPLGVGYAAHLPASPGTVADMLNAQTRTMVKAIHSTTAQAWAASGPYAAIVDASSNTAHPSRASCLVLRETLASGVDIHVERSDVQQMLKDWVTNGVCTQAQHDDLMSRATVACSRMEELGFPYATVQDVIGAM